MPKREAVIQSAFMKRLEEIFPEMLWLKVDSTNRPGWPDVIFFVGHRYGVLEFKAERGSHRQPNQDYWVDRFNTMSYGRFVYPENVGEALDEILQTFRPEW